MKGFGAATPVFVIAAALVAVPTWVTAPVLVAIGFGILAADKFGAKGYGAAAVVVGAVLAIQGFYDLGNPTIRETSNTVTHTIKTTADEIDIGN